MKTKPTITKCLAVLALGYSIVVQAQNIPVVHWINDVGSNAVAVLNSNGFFTTDFKAHNDLRVTPLTTNSVMFYPSGEAFGGTTPGNNPAYLTNFLGLTNNGTGNGVKGNLQELWTTTNNTGTLQFDFLTPLTPQDRILLTDVDGTEQYLLQAYIVTASSSNQVSFVGWLTNSFSGGTGVTPDTRWPVWNAAAGTLTSSTSQDLSSPLFVLTPAQNINRLVLTKQNGPNWESGITFLSLQTPLTIKQSGTNVVLTWTNSAFGLQAAPAVTGTYTNIPGAASPYTNPITGPQKFFRPIAN